MSSGDWRSNPFLAVHSSFHRLPVMSTQACIAHMTSSSPERKAGCFRNVQINPFRKNKYAFSMLCRNEMIQVQGYFQETVTESYYSFYHQPSKWWYSHENEFFFFWKTTRDQSLTPTALNSTFLNWKLIYHSDLILQHIFPLHLYSRIKSTVAICCSVWWNFGTWVKLFFFPVLLL